MVVDAADGIGRGTQCVSGSMDASQYSYLSLLRYNMFTHVCI